MTLQKKREILLNNIYGVDIDAQAVEVCHLSLYLKLLADETTASAHQYLLDFERQALLPTLTRNIVCGNSLIGTDILEGQLFAGDEEKKLNPMNFEDAFPEIMKGGGFDTIVGNPPFVDSEEMVRSSLILRKYAIGRYIYHFFINHKRRIFHTYEIFRYPFAQNLAETCKERTNQCHISCTYCHYLFPQLVR